MSLCIAGVVGVVALFPSYIHARIEEQVQLDEAAQLKKNNDSSGQASLEKQLNADTIVLGNTRNDGGSMRASKAITDVISLRGQVRILSMSFTSLSSPTVSLTLQGYAPTREDLLSFKERLESQLAGGKVDLPVALLARKSDISFSINLSYSYP